MSTNRHSALLAPFVAALGILVACGDDTDPSGAGGGGASTTAGPSTSTNATTASDSSSSASNSSSDSSSSVGGGGGAGGGGGVGGGGGAGGGEPLCRPAETQPCYTGPAGTEGMGLCIGGMLTCLDDGSAFGPCEGEVTPIAETCNTAGDDDCDGQTNEEGAGCVCVPSWTTTCYSGPPGTEGVGVCTPGTATCSDQGTILGPCVGEIVPAFDDCDTIADEDCDGLTPSSCPGSALWSKGFGAVGPDTAGGVVSDSSGNVITAGSFMAAVDFGGGTLTSAGSSDAFVAKYDAVGNHVWSKRFGDVNSQGADAVAVDSTDNVILAGRAQGTVDFGGGAMSQVGNYDIFLVKLDASGNHVWSHRFGAALLGHAVHSVATDAAGNVIITGEVAGAASYGGSSLPGANGADVFVAKYDAAGNHLWSKRFGTMALQYARSVVVDPSGNILLTGYFAGTFDFGGAPLTSAGFYDVFVAKLDAAGNHVWSKRVGNGDEQYGNSVATDAAGNVIHTGWFEGIVDFGGGPLTSSGSMDAFIVKYDPTGAHLWSKHFGGTNGQYGHAVATDPAGNVLFGGYFYGFSDFGGGTLLNLTSTTDVVVAKYDPAGNHLWSKDFGDLEIQYVTAVASDPAGNVLVTGEFYGDMTFSGTTHTSAGFRDVYVAKLEP